MGHSPASRKRQPGRVSASNALIIFPGAPAATAGTGAFGSGCVPLVVFAGGEPPTLWSLMGEAPGGGSEGGLT